MTENNNFDGRILCDREVKLQNNQSVRYKCAYCGKQKTERSMQIIDNQWVCKYGNCN